MASRRGDSHCSISILPSEIIREILLFLPWEHFSVITKLSKQWAEPLESDSFYRDLLQTQFRHLPLPENLSEYVDVAATGSARLRKNPAGGVFSDDEKYFTHCSWKSLFVEILQNGLFRMQRRDWAGESPSTHFTVNVLSSVRRRSFLSELLDSAHVGEEDEGCDCAMGEAYTYSGQCMSPLCPYRSGLWIEGRSEPSGAEYVFTQSYARDKKKNDLKAMLVYDRRDPVGTLLPFVREEREKKMIGEYCVLAVVGYVPTGSTARRRGKLKMRLGQLSLMKRVASSASSDSDSDTSSPDTSDEEDDADLVRDWIEYDAVAQELAHSLGAGLFLYDFACARDSDLWRMTGFRVARAVTYREVVWVRRRRMRELARKSGRWEDIEEEIVRIGVMTDLGEGFGEGSV